MTRLRVSPSRADAHVVAAKFSNDFLSEPLVSLILWPLSIPHGGQSLINSENPPPLKSSSKFSFFFFFFANLDKDLNFQRNRADWTLPGCVGVYRSILIELRYSDNSFLNKGLEENKTLSSAKKFFTYFRCVIRIIIQMDLVPREKEHFSILSGHSLDHRLFDNLAKVLVAILGRALGLLLAGDLTGFDDHLRDLAGCTSVVTVSAISTVMLLRFVHLAVVRVPAT